MTEKNVGKVSSMRGTYHLCDFPLAEEQACLGGEGRDPLEFASYKQTPWQLEAVKTNPGDWLPRFQVFSMEESLHFRNPPHISKQGLMDRVSSPHTVL